MKTKTRLNKVSSQEIIISILIFLTLLLTFFSLLFWRATEEADKSSAESLGDKQELMVRAAADSVERLFKERKAGLLLLTHVESIKASTDEGREIIANIVNDISTEPLASIVRVDKNGKTVWSENPHGEKVALGVDVSDRDYFLWAKEQNESDGIFISDPFISRGGPTKGDWVVSIASPVFYRGEFDGLVFISFTPKEIYKQYVNPLEFSEKTVFYLVNEKGIVVSSNFDSPIGQNVNSYFAGLDWLGKERMMGMVKASMQGMYGRNIITYPIEDSKGQNYIVIYKPVLAGDKTWSLWIGTPHIEAYDSNRLVKSVQRNIFIFYSIGILLLCLCFILAFRIGRAESYKAGFKKGYHSKAIEYKKKKA